MTNLLDDIASKHVPLADDLHAEICRACREAARGDEAKRVRLQRALVARITEALLGRCGQTLRYDPRFIAEFVTGRRDLDGGPRPM